MTPRVEDAALLFGRGRFLDDLDPLPGALSAAVVRSPHPHARIRGVDTAAALGAPGVAAVIGPDEVAAELRPFPLSVKTPMPYHAGATSRARFVGEPVAVVVATDRDLAEDAAELVQVDYEPLPSVTDTAKRCGTPRLCCTRRRPATWRRTARHVWPRRRSVLPCRPRDQRGVLLPSVLLDADGVLLGGDRLDGQRRRPGPGGGGVGQLPRAVLHGAGAGPRARPAGVPAPAARAGRHRRQLRHQGRIYPTSR